MQSDCFCSLNLLLCGRVPSPWSLLKVAEYSFLCTGVRRRYLETMYFWTPKIGMV